MPARWAPRPSPPPRSARALRWSPPGWGTTCAPGSPSAGRPSPRSWRTRSRSAWRSPAPRADRRRVPQSGSLHAGGLRGDDRADPLATGRHLRAAAPSDTPVLDTLLAMTAESVARCGLDDNALVSARIAALAAVDAPAASYLMHVGPA